METKLSWKKGIFSSICNIYSGSSIVGELKEKLFSRQLNASINGKYYTFKKKSIFSNETQIIDESTRMQAGIIKFNAWNTKALINIGDTLFNWKFSNAWHTKWTVENSDGEKINYKGHDYKGSIESQIENDLLLLSGLTVTTVNRRSGTYAFYIVFFVIMFQQIMH